VDKICKEIKISDYVAVIDICAALSVKNNMDYILDFMNTSSADSKFVYIDSNLHSMQYVTRHNRTPQPFTSGSSVDDIFIFFDQGHITG
jgi:hypothetical protein